MKRILLTLALLTLAIPFAQGEGKDDFTVSLDVPKGFDPAKQVLWLDVKHAEIPEGVGLHFAAVLPHDKAKPTDQDTPIGDIGRWEVTPRIPAGTKSFWIDRIDIIDKNKIVLRWCRIDSKHSRTHDGPKLFSTLAMRAEKWDESLVKCPYCGGSGKRDFYRDGCDEKTGGKVGVIECAACSGKGQCEKTHANLWRWQYEERDWHSMKWYEEKYGTKYESELNKRLLAEQIRIGAKAKK